MKESDHNTLILQWNQEWNSAVKLTEPRQEILNFKKEEDFAMFFDLTNNSEELSKFFDDKNEDLETASKKWLKHIKLIMKASFSKLRIKKGNLNPKLQLLFQQKESLKAKLGKHEKENNTEEINELQVSLDSVNKKIATICAEKNKTLVNEYLGKTNDTIEGFNQAKTWGCKSCYSQCT